MTRQEVADRECEGCRYVEGENTETESDAEEECLFEATIGTDAIRSAIRTVEAQLELSSPQQFIDPELKAECKNLLRDESAKELPSCVAAFPSMTAGPCLLFKCVQLDALHALDLGPVRDFCDKAYVVFLKRSRLEGVRSKASMVKEANLCIHDLPKIAHVSKRSPFNSTEGERKSGMTGKQRRELAPFLWFAAMALDSHFCPDEDELFITALMVDRVYAELKGVNKSSEEMKWTERRIEKIQTLCQETFSKFRKVFDVPINTKMHRSMNLVKGQVVNYGSIALGDASENETLHLGLKKML